MIASPRKPISGSAGLRFGNVKETFRKRRVKMISRIVRFSWLAGTLLIPLALWSQTSPTAQTTAPVQATAIDQTASPAQQTASLLESAEPGLKYDLSIHMTDGSIAHAVQAEPGISCKQKCLDIYDICIKQNPPPTDCESNYKACVKKCG
jgi:hypothetical protein